MALQTSFPPSSSSRSFSSSSFSYAWKYHVFLSFRGPDTRRGFTGHLYKALRDRGIRTFIDDEDLQRGEEITPSLIKAIEESRIAIPVFSKSYASSTYCLDELVKIMECVKGKGRLVLPVFYDVEPTDVRHQRGSYGEALDRHEERFKDGKIKVLKWRKALREAASLSGEHLKLGNENEYVFIEKIVKEISKKINRVPLHVADYPVGLESRVLEVNSLLNDDFDGGVQVVGIHGIGGIGKTTLARAVYNLIADQFEDLCFLENMSELSIKYGLPYLQKMLLSEILGEKVCKLGSVNELIPIIRERLQCKKVLLVLDDIDKHEQLHAFTGMLDWSGSCSKVIMTTRNKHLLKIYEVKKVYEVGVLNEERAIDLLTWKAFKSEKVEPCYMDILKELVTYASGLPLALEVIGSNLFGKSVPEWRSALNVYKKIPNENLQEKLKVSFDALHPQEKSFFLDIACCFGGYELTKVVGILHAHYNVDPTYSIGVLVDKSLIKVGTHVTLHDLIQDMGREIVRIESPEEVGARSRLWLAEDIIKVLQEDKGSSKIQITHLEFGYNGDVIEWDGQAFRKMENLITLIVKRGRFSQSPKYLPNSLRVLNWETYPSEESLPSYFHPKQLVILQLPRNSFDSVHLAELMKKKFESMKVLKFDFCQHITKMPNLSSAPKLEVLSFRWCDNLTEIDESVGSLGELKTLDAFGCSQLRSLPPLMLPALERLYLHCCSSLESFPEILGKMESMTYLSLSYISVTKLPYSIHNLIGLRKFYLRACGVVELPSGIMLPEAKTLHFMRCKGLVLPNQGEGEEHVSSTPFSNTTYLCIDNCNISEEFLRIVLPMFPSLQILSLISENFRILPECIEEFEFLTILRLIDCTKLEEIRGLPPNIEELFVVNCASLSALTREMLLNKKLHEEGQDKMFILPEPGERLPMWFEDRRRKSSIAFWFRNKFPAISFGLFTWSDPLDQSTIRPRLTINGAKSFQLVAHDYEASDADQGVGHILIFSKTQTTFRDQVGEALSENEWNHAVIAVYDDEPFDPNELDCVQVGIHIIKEKSCMDDIRFTDPLLHEERDTLRDMGDSQKHTQFVQQQQTNSKEMSSTTTLNVHGCGTSSRKKKRTTARLDLNNDLTSQSSSVMKESFKEKIEDSFDEAEEQSPIRKRKTSSSSVKTHAKIQKTATEQDVLTIFSKNHEKDSDVEVLETTIVPTSISEANHGSYESSIQAENADQPLNSLIEIQPPSPQPLDPLAELERLLLESYDLTLESSSFAAASSSDIQASEVVIILQNLEALLDNPLGILTADGEIKHHTLDCLSKLGQLEDHIPIPLQSIVAQVRAFYEDLIQNFPFIQQTLVDYSSLEETRSKFLENLNQAKAKQAQIDAEVLQEKVQVEELDAEIADLEIKLKAAVENRNKLQLAIKNGEAEKNKILKDASAWLMESKQVVKKIKSSEHAYRDAQNSKARLEGRLATLKGAFAANNSKR